MDWLRYQNQSAIRNKPLSQDLVSALSFLPEMGITMNVVSGGQDPSGGQRTGSTRHDHGGAVDADFYMGDRKLDWNNPADAPVFAEIVKRARSNGVTGIGAGDDYMGAGRMHIGFGNEAVWGANGKRANAPEWLVAAYNGATPQNTPRSLADATMSAIGKGPRPTPFNPEASVSTQGGLLGGMLNDEDMQPMEQEKAGGILGSLLPGLTANGADQLALALGGMSPYTNPQFMNGLRDSISQRGARQDQRAEQMQAQRQAQMQVNQTVDFLKNNQAPDYLIRAAMAGKAGEAFKEYMRLKGQKPAAQPAALQQYEYAVQQGYDGSFIDFQTELSAAGAPSVSTTVNTGNEVDARPITDKPEKSMQRRWDPENQTWVDEVIPGSAGAMERAAAEEQAAQAASSNQETQARETDVALENIGAIKETINRSGMFDLPETGIVGDRLARAGINQEAVNVKNRLASLQGLIGFDRLQRMRDESPTGGALGAISERELELLSAQLGTLNQSSDRETLMDTLDRVENIYRGILKKAQAYPNASNYGFGGGGGGTSGADDADLLKKYGSQ